MPNPNLVGLEQAVAASVGPGSIVYIGNFGASLHCVGREIIRQGHRDLHIVMASGGILLDALIGSGVASAATFAHCWGPIGPTPAWNFRREAETDRATCSFVELSLGSLYAALLGGAWAVPFMPIHGLEATGYATEDWGGGALGHASSDFGECAVVRSLTPDVAFIHVDAVDSWGNATFGGPHGDALVAAQAAQRTIVVAEELCGGDAGLATPGSLPGILVSDIVVRPGAVSPDGALGRYPRDVDEYRRYGERSRTREGFAAWVDQEVN